MEQLKRNSQITLPVLSKRKIDSRQCYIVQTPDGRQQAITLLRCQFDEETPEQLRCIVKDINPISGELILEQDFSHYLRRFYEVGKEYEFFVTRESGVGSKKKTITLGDDYGFRFTISEKTSLRIHQHVLCQVEDISGNNLKLHLSESVIQESEKSKNLKERLSDAIEARITERSWNLKDFLALLFSGQDMKSFQEQCTIWLQQEMLRESDAMHQTLTSIHEACLFLLEESDILKRENHGERHDLQERISKLLDLTERFEEAADIVSKDQCDDYIDSLLTKLRNSGYLYHPNHRLGILITIFALRPELMESRMGELMEVIHEGTLDYWQQEPFRSAFIRLLELFIKANRQHADLVSTGASNGVRSIITAISVQLLLASTLDEEGLAKLPCDLRLNRSMLYRYASYLRTSSPKTLLERSFRCLIEMPDAVLHYGWEDTKNVEILANLLCSYADTESNDDVSDLMQHTYEGNKATLRISKNGFFVYPIQEQDTVPVLPEDLALWHQMQVMLPESLSRKTRVNMDTLRPHKQAWKEIEASLFAEKKVEKKKVRKFYPEQGEIVHIRIDKVVGDSLHCIIEEEHLKGEGAMQITDIVDWNPKMYEECFLDEYKNPLLFPVKVVSVTPDGVCTFNMKRLIREWLREEFTYNDQTVMKVKNILGNQAIGFTRNGIPVVAIIPDDMDTAVVSHDYLEVIKDLDDDGKHSNITVSAIRHTTATWDETGAFMNLMNLYADDILDDETEAKDREVFTEGTEMDPVYVQELMLLIDRQAAVEPTIRSYNYLGMARILAMMMGKEDIASYYEWRMKLLEMLQDFSLNESIDQASLDKLLQADRDIFAPGSQLRLRFLQITAISCQGHPERNHELWSIIQNEKEENLQELASMVLSWNFTAEKEMPHAQEEIGSRIFKLLNLKQRTTNKKNYGREGQQVEFKTSMVYPPENHFRPDLKQQTLAILKEVAAFLNAEGGTLYLGVNDSGLATGLEQDLAYRPFCYSQDKYDIYFHNQVKAHLGQEANSLINCSWEDANDRAVYVVTVKPCPHVVLLNGTIYERQDSSSEPLIGAYREEFMKKRPLLGAQMAEEIQPVKAETESSASGFKLSEISNTIATSQWRNNVLFNWEPDYVEPEAYLCLLPGYKFSLLDSDQPPYDPDTYDLALTIRQEESSGSLILIYEKGLVCRVPMREILEKQRFTEFMRASETLKFACPATDEDYLFTMIRDANGYLLYRTDRIDSLPKDKITSTGDVLSPYNSYEILLADIVPARLAHYCRETPGKAVGISAFTGIGPSLRADLCRELGISIDAE